MNEFNFNSYDNSTQKIITEGYEKKGGVNNSHKTPRPDNSRGQECCECMWWRELEYHKALNKTLMDKLMQKDEVNVFFNTPIEGWSNDPCGICPHKAEIDQLKAKNEELKDKLNCCFCTPYVELNDTEKQRKCVEVTECFRRQLNKLKAENEELKEELEELKEENEYNEANTIEFKQTLIEIKEIAETAAKCMYTTYSDDYTEGYSWLGRIILQKISECEGNDETNN